MMKFARSRRTGLRWTTKSSSAISVTLPSYEQIASGDPRRGGRIDAAEDEVHGAARGDELPEHLTTREGRLACVLIRRPCGSTLAVGARHRRARAG